MLSRCAFEVTDTQRIRTDAEQPVQPRNVGSQHSGRVKPVLATPSHHIALLVLCDDATTTAQPTHQQCPSSIALKVQGQCPSDQKAVSSTVSDTGWSIAYHQASTSHPVIRYHKNRPNQCCHYLLFYSLIQ